MPELTAVMRGVIRTNVDLLAGLGGQVADGLTVGETGAAEDWLLVGQDLSAENGPYTFTPNAGWARHVGMDSPGEFVYRTRVYVGPGQVEAGDSEWYYGGPNNPTLGITLLVFYLHAWRTPLDAGSGLERNGNKLQLPQRGGVQGTKTNPVITHDDRGVATAVQSRADAQTTLAEGLKAVWLSANSLRIEAGAILVPGVGLLDFPDPVDKTGLVLTASTWYYAYAYQAETGPAIEIVTTAPDAPYRGNARLKPGDPTRRYVPRSAVYTSAANTMRNFAVMPGGFVRWKIGPDALAVVANAANTAYQSASTAPFQPPTSRGVFVAGRISNSANSSRLYVTSSDEAAGVRYDRAMPRAFAVLCLVLALAACSSREPDSRVLATSTAPERPNVLLILTDDQGDGDGSLERMPKVQGRLVDEGTSFSNAYPTTNTCCPSRATFLRGQYAHSHGIFSNNGPEGGYPGFQARNLEDSTAATWLQAAGYKTAYAGKYLNEYGERSFTRHVPPGWGYFWGRQGGNGGNTYTVNANGDLKTFDRDAYHETDYYSDRAAAFIGAHRSAPWAMVVAPSSPHHPFQAARRHEDMFRNAKMPRTPAFNEADVSDKPPFVRDRPRLGADGISRVEGDWRQRMRSLQAVDDMVGRLYWELKNTGQLDNTYIIFASDNGYSLYRNRIETKGPAYSGASGIPFVVRGPGVPAGQTRAELVANLDVAPTLADLAGADAPGFVEGRSLAPLLSAAPGEAPPWRDSLLQEYDNVLRYSAVRTEAGELYVEYEGGEREHYRADDPHQLENDYPRADPARMAELSARLDALKSCSGDSCRLADAPEPAETTAP